jgi:hypothetical protein
MTHNNRDKFDIHKFIYRRLLLTTLLLITVTLAFSQDDRKIETIDSTARGTSTQMGRMIGVKVTIFYSTPRRKIDNFLLMPSRKARIKVWSMHLAR